MTEKEAIKALKLINLTRVHPFYSWEEMAEVRDMAVKALEEIQQYREIGTVEACREAAEKQKAKRPRIHKERFSSTYSCQKCGCVLIHKDETGWFCGRHYKFCPDCGEPIDWSEEE